MSYAERIETTINSLSLGRPVFKISVGRTMISVDEERWNTQLDESDVINYYVNRYARRKYDVNIREYTVDHNSVVKEFAADLNSNSISMFMACSPYKEPRRTNIYRDFCETLSSNRFDQEFNNSLFNIYEYYWSNTRSKKISHPDNSVHRTNIYNLLCLMEKSYGNNGKKTSN